MTTDSSSLEDFKEAITDNEHSIGEKAPGTPFVLVALSYLAVLATACGGIVLLMWAMK